MKLPLWASLVCLLCSTSHPDALQSLASYAFYSFDVITTLMSLDGAPLILAQHPYLPQGEVSVLTSWEFLRNVVSVAIFVHLKCPAFHWLESYS